MGEVMMGANHYKEKNPNFCSIGVTISNKQLVNLIDIV
jgi:hypothetical protein